jgi:hypothetical protein
MSININYNLGLVNGILYQGNDVNKLYLDTELIWEKLTSNLNAQVMDSPSAFGVISFSISEQSSEVDGVTHWSMDGRKLDGTSPRRTGNTANWMKVLLNRASDNAYGDNQPVTPDDLEQFSIVLDESYNGEWEFTFRGRKYDELADGNISIIDISEQIVNHNISFFSELDESIDIGSTCGSINVSLGRDVLGVSDSWIVNVYKGDEYVYVSREEIIDESISGTCLKTESLDCIDTEDGDILVIQGYARVVEYDTGSGNAIDDVDLECLMAEIDWESTGETIDWQVAGRAIACLQHESLPEVIEVDCIQTHMCESLQTHRGECIQFEGWARETGCQVTLDPDDPTLLIDPTTYPLFTEQGLSITDEDGSVIERQGAYSVLRFETETGDGIFTEIGRALERETHEQLITTEQGRPIDINKAISPTIGIYDPITQLTPLRENSHELLSSTSVLASSTMELDLPSPGQYYVEVVVLDEDGNSIRTITADELYVASCVCLETEDGTCFETEDHYIMQVEYNPLAPGAPGVISPDVVCMSTESGECLLTQDGEPVEPQGYYPYWQGVPEPGLLGECIETESGECFETEDNRVLRIEYIEVVPFNGDCLSTESEDCLLTHEDNPIEPQGFYANWQAVA